MPAAIPEDESNSECARPKRLSRDPDQASIERFRTQIAGLKVEIETRSRDSKAGWSSVATEHVKSAERFCRNGEIDAAWSTLKAASRELLESYTGSELTLEAARVRREAIEKLHDWRLAVVEDVLPDPKLLRGEMTTSLGTADTKVQRQPRAELEENSNPDDQDLIELRNRVRMVRVILDEDSDNVHQRLRLLSGQLLLATLWLACVLAAAVLIIFAFTQWGWDPSSEEALLADPKTVVVVMTLGAIGGATSGLFTLLHPGARLRIPDVKAQRYLILLRPVIGGAAALIVVAILRSGIGGVQMDPEAALGAAFVAGFSERTVSRAVAAASAAIAK